MQTLNLLTGQQVVLANFLI